MKRSNRFIFNYFMWLTVAVIGAIIGSDILLLAGAISSSVWSAAEELYRTRSV